MKDSEIIEYASEALKHCSNCRSRGCFDEDIKDTVWGCQNHERRDFVMERDKCDNRFYLNYAFETDGNHKPFCGQYTRDLLALKRDIMREWAKLTEKDLK